MDLQLCDKVIVMATSSKGLGFGIAEALAHEGTRAAMGTRSLTKLTTA
jgi:hypothetical protein